MNGLPNKVTKPGRLPPIPTIRPLATISPTMFTNLRKCCLRAIWSRAPHYGLLPRHPAAIMGSISHRVMEEYGKSPNKPLDDFEKCWAEAEKSFEITMVDNWTECHLVPVRDWVRDYSQKKTLRMQTINEMSRRVERIVKKDCGIRRVGSELPLATPDGLCSGRADLVRPINGELEIIEYKTGRGFLEALWPMGDGIPEDAATQLKLYAGIYFLEFGVWVSSLRVIIGSNSIDVPFQK